MSPPASGRDPVAVLGRLLASPRGDATGARRRLDLLRTLMRHGGGWWRAEDLARPDRSDLDDLRAGLRELRKAGVLDWDERAQAFTLHEPLRVPLALLLLASGEGPQHQGQLSQLDALVPFAMVASRGDERQAPVWAMLDVLERDLRAMQLAAADGPQALERCAKERWLIRHAEDMRAAVDRLEAISQTPADRALIERAVTLINQTGEMLARLSVRMSRTTRDQVRMAGSRHSAAELRHAAAQLPAADLAAIVDIHVGVAPATVALPDEIAVAAALPHHLITGDDDHGGEQLRAFPDVTELQPESSTPPEPDAVQLASDRLTAAPPRRMAAHLFAPLDCWSDAVRLQQGLVRVQAEAARLGRPGWHTLPETVRLAAPAPVAALNEIERAA